MLDLIHWIKIQQHRKGWAAWVARLTEAVVDCGLAVMVRLRWAGRLCGAGMLAAVELAEEHSERDGGG